MSNLEVIVIKDDSDHESSHSKSPPADTVDTPPLNSSKVETSVDRDLDSHDLGSSHHGHSSPEVDSDRPFWSASSSPMESGIDQAGVRESSQVPQGPGSSIFDTEVDSSQFNTMRSAMNALQAISNKPDAACSRDVIEIADQNLQLVEAIRGLTSDTISRAGLRTFLGRQMGCAFPGDNSRKFCPRLRLLLQKCNEIMGMNNTIKEVDDLISSGRITISSSPEAGNGEPAAANTTTTTTPMRNEVRQIASDVLHNNHESPTSHATEISSSAPTEAHTRRSTSSLGESPQSKHRSSSQFSSQLATVQGLSTSDSDEAVEPKLENLHPASRTSLPSQQRLVESPTPKLEASDTLTSIESKIKDLEEQIDATTATLQYADSKIIEISLAACNLEEEIKNKKETKKPLYEERRHLTRQINTLNAEIREHEADLEEKNEATQQHGKDKTDAQNMLNKLAASKKKQEKKLELMLEDERLQQEIPDATLRAMAKRLRGKPEQDEWDLESDTDGEENEDDNDSLFSSGIDDEDKALQKTNSSDTEADHEYLLDDLVNAYTNVADKDSNAVTMSDFTEMDQAFEKLTGTNYIKEDLSDSIKPEVKGEAGIKPEIKHEAGIKLEALDDCDSKNSIDVSDSRRVLSSTELDLTNIDLSNITADDLRRKVKAVREGHAWLEQLFALLGDKSTLQNPEPDRISPHPTSFAGLKRKKPGSGGPAEPNFFDKIGPPRPRQVSQVARPAAHASKSRSHTGADDDYEETQLAKRSKISPSFEGSPSPLRRISLSKHLKEIGWRKPESMMDGRRGGSIAEDLDGDHENDDEVLPEAAFSSSGVKSFFNDN